MTSIPPRVFVSSVLKDFEAYRSAAAEGIRDAGAEPVRVNEDFPALPDSSRNACLDAVASCDAFLLVLGETAGWQTPACKFVIEEEYEEAVRRGIPIYVFLLIVDRDAESQRFENRVSDYVLGKFRTSVRSPDDLRAAVKDALTNITSRKMRLPDPAIRERLTAKESQSQHPVLRLVVASGREEEIVDPLNILREEFQDELIKIASATPHPLFGIRKEKSVVATTQSITILQNDDHGSHGSTWQSRFAIDAAGLVTAQTSIGPHSTARSYGLSTSMTVQASDLKDAAEAVFHSVNRVLTSIDPFVRHTQLCYNVAVHNLAYRYIVDSAPQTGTGVPMRMSSGDPVIAYDTCRPIAREVLNKPDSEIARVVQMLKHGAAK